MPHSLNRVDPSEVDVLERDQEGERPAVEGVSHVRGREDHKDLPPAVEPRGGLHRAGLPCAEVGHAWIMFFLLVFGT